MAIATSAKVLRFPASPDPAPAPWERQPGEGARAYSAFIAYRDMGNERSLAKVGQQLGKKRQLLERWSRRHGWVPRVDAWDKAEQARLDEERWRWRRKGIREAEERHVALATAFQARIVARLQSLNPSELSPADMARWLDVAVKIERLALGEETERIAQEHGGRVDGLADDLAARLMASPEAARAAHDLLSILAGEGCQTGENVPTVAHSDANQHGRDDLSSEKPTNPHV